MSNYYSPLRYPGSKAKISFYFKKVFEKNNMSNMTYIEPYAGGASVALTLLFSGHASKIIINDNDRSIFAFWHSVIHNTDELCRLIQDTKLDIDLWKNQKNIQKDKGNCDLLELGFSTFILNRTNYSGIINAGIIGGVNQTGKWKMDARYNKKILIEKIEGIATYKNNIEIYNYDCIDLIKTFKSRNKKNTFFYFDPPYYMKGKQLYLNFYNDSDHLKVSKELKKIKSNNWILTYDYVPFIKRLYSGFKNFKFTLRYSLSKSYKGHELMIFSNNLTAPRFIN